MIIMSPNRSLFSPPDSEDLFDSLTGELVYSPKKSIWSDTYADANRIQKLQNSISSLGGRIKINTPPPPSPDFLPNAYYRSAVEDMSEYSDFEDYIQKNMNRFNF